MDYLYKYGEPTVDGVKWEIYREIRRAAVENRKLTVEFKEIAVKDALAHLSFLTGASYGVGVEDAEKVVTVSLKDVTVSEIISRVSAQAGVKIEGAAKRAALN
jgi:hypothetical protein